MSNSRSFHNLNSLHNIYSSGVYGHGGTNGAPNESIYTSESIYGTRYGSHLYQEGKTKSTIACNNVNCTTDDLALDRRPTNHDYQIDSVNFYI